VQQRWVTEATAQLAALCPSDEQPPLQVVRAVEIGTHGRGAVQQLLRGSVAEQVVRARC